MKSNYSRLPVLILLTILLALSGCRGNRETQSGSNVVHITGAGSTFAAPLYNRWIEVYTKDHTDVGISYDAVGSGEGTKRFIAGTVDFGASDSAMTDEKMAEVSSGVQLIPATAGAIVLAYNIPNLNGKLKLSRKVYADIFLGRIRMWNDPRIKEDNPGLNLPDMNIVTVVRSDSSGTTWAFTNHLSAISKEWRENGPGVGKEIDFPGNAMFGSGNGGVAAKIKNSRASIGYVEYGFAKRAALSMALLENKAGNFVEPDDSSPTETLANTASTMPANLRLFLPDPDGKTSYPIVTYSWLLLNKRYDDKSKEAKLKEFISWGLTKGQKFGPELGYAPLPGQVADAALKAVKNIN
ncbi:MAG TPA: phosphate ABC transporter substrate-binding protein PstS [Desulfobulbus sp.]|nr:phosphate ABC transporter substrate-binding protein PstS [Desulfobulbus sp.]